MLLPTPREAPDHTQPRCHRLALVTAAKAVALALCPGLEVIKHATLWSKKRGLGPYVEFVDSTDNLEPGWHPEQIEVFDYATNIKVGSRRCKPCTQPAGHCCRLQGCAAGCVTVLSSGWTTLLC